MIRLALRVCEECEREQTHVRNLESEEWDCLVCQGLMDEGSVEVPGGSIMDLMVAANLLKDLAE